MTHQAPEWDCTWHSHTCLLLQRMYLRRDLMLQQNPGNCTNQDSDISYKFLCTCRTATQTKHFIAEHADPDATNPYTSQLTSLRGNCGQIP